jgi:hypothetical protein
MCRIGLLLCALLAAAALALSDMSWVAHIFRRTQRI